MKTLMLIGVILLVGGCGKGKEAPSHINVGMDSILAMPLYFPDSGGGDLSVKEHLAIVVGLIVFCGVVMGAQELVTRIRRKRKNRGGAKKKDG